jgi:hypothetical protein
MQPDMLIAALPADLHLYARPPASCSIPPLVPMSWPPMQLRGAAAQRTAARGGVPASNVAAGPWRQAPILRPVQTGHAPLSTGGMSYGKLPSGACGLIRLLRVSRLANRHAPSRTYRLIHG